MSLKTKLGELLVESNKITELQLQEALRSKRPDELLGRTLIKLGFVTEQDLINTLEFQLGIMPYDFAGCRLDARIVKLLPATVARKYLIIPVRLAAKKLTIAMADPLNTVAIEKIKLLTGLEIEPLLAREDEIKAAIEEYYGSLEPAEQPVVELACKAIDARSNLSERTEVPADENEAPVVQMVNAIIQQAVLAKASDIHIEPKEDKVLVRLRIDGLLRVAMTLVKNLAAAVVSRIKILADMDIAEKRLPQDGRIQLTVEGREIDIRVSSIPVLWGEKIVLRILDKTKMSIELGKLGFKEDILPKYRKLIQNPHGMILITGPTGSGKTTTLYASLHEIDSYAKNIVTIEDPVEYVLENINQTGINPKAGLNFATGLRAILRQDPDIIMVGEIRDRETADIAVRAATTGHLVFSTLHTNDAPGALPRLIDMGVEPFLVASAVEGIMAQRLVRLICPKCKQPYQVPKNAPERLFLGILEEEITLYRGTGCRSCGNTGFQGRTVIQELLLVTQEIKELILQKSSAQLIKQTAMEQGFMPLKSHGIGKVLMGLTTVEEVQRVADTEA